LDFLRSHYYMNITESSPVVNRLTPTLEILTIPLRWVLLRRASTLVVRSRRHWIRYLTNFGLT
ncbi:MAG: hypothetical protein WBE28_00110, partial [bacterium]